ncbi:hypothetical protein HOC32_01280 [Candidatus Woesearchaeota archaeon]|jgi:hypothetical protein|nr:hypothetical protein [Candidatus Woesearchaeota archaeon]
MTELNELKRSMLTLERQIKPLEYDASRNQIHDYKRAQLKKMKDDYVALKQQLKSVLSE